MYSSARLKHLSPGLRVGPGTVLPRLGELRSKSRMNDCELWEKHRPSGHGRHPDRRINRALASPAKGAPTALGTDLSVDPTGSGIGYERYRAY